MSPNRKDHRRSLRSWYVWHRWVGILCALLVIWLAVTGILLNHATRLGLDRQFLHSRWLLHAYGIPAQPPETGFPVGGRWVSQAGDQLFLDAKPVAVLRGPLVGAVALPDAIVAATPESVLLFTADGELIETLSGEAVPGPIQSMAGDGRQFLIQTPETTYTGNLDLIDFARHSGGPPSAASAQRLPAEIAQAITASGAGIRLSRERVLADLHSGRLFGRYGPLVMDLASLGFIFLAASGLWLWWRYRQSRQDRMLHRRR